MSTILALSWTHGVEANPLTRSALQSLGMLGWALVQMGVCALVVLLLAALGMLLRRLSAFILWLLCLEFAAATLWNVAALLMWLVRSR